MKKIAIAIVLLLVLTGCGAKKEKEVKFDLNPTLTKVVSKFYEDNYKGQIEGPTVIIVNFDNLKNANMDVSKILGPKKEGCEPTSYSNLDLKADGTYTVSNFYVCGEYKTDKTVK